MKRFTLLCLCGLVLAGCGSSDPWKQADKIVSSMTKVSIPEREVTITDLGAVPGDSLNPCHDIINLAIINMSLQGGGAVKIPAGVFYTGPITHFPGEKLSGTAAAKAPENNGGASASPVTGGTPFTMDAE